HRGLTVFLFPLHQPGVEVHQIEMLNGSKEFCQEFLSDLRVPDTDRLGEVDDGWTVGARWMFHERTLFSSPLVTMPVGTSHGIGGGTTEMARNVISERVLGMPRERSFDRDVPFRDVPRGPTGRTG